ncbi:hypothetical protein JCM17960_01750 [Magnetospira thiophila]
MTDNPFIVTMRRNPKAFLDGLTTSELNAIAEACVRLMERRAKEGDEAAGPCLQSLYRTLGEVEV